MHKNNEKTYRDDFMKRSTPTSLALAFCFLGAQGAAHAAVIANFNVDEVDSFSFAKSINVQSASGAGSGTATLDDSGLVTMHLTNTSAIYESVNISRLYTSVADTKFYGSWSEGIFTPNSGQPNWTSCAELPGSSGGCFLAAGSSGAAFFGSVGGALAISGGTLVSSLSQIGGETLHSTYTFTPAVPIPTTAWLFGSGLIGLAGATRKRKSS
jgi:hypothetical protein